MDIIWTILKFIVANILLIVVSSTLIGISLRGYLQPSVYTNTGNHNSFFYSISPRTGFIFSTIASAVSIVILCMIFKNINIYVFLGVILAMFSRIKDLLREIKTGHKTSKKNMTSKPIDNVFNLIFFIGFGLFNYGVYLFLNK